MRRWMAMLVPAAALVLAACKTEVICPSNQTACGEVCRTLQADPQNCGACGKACPASEVCQAGACTTCALGCTSARGCQAGLCLPDLEVACFASGEVQGLAGDLSATGPATKVDGGPISLAPLAGRTWVAHSFPTPTLRGVGLDGSATASLVLGGGDLEIVRSYAGAYGRAAGLLYVSDVTSSSIVVVDPDRAASDPAHAVVDEVVVRRVTGVGENPHGIAFAGGKAYVALSGDFNSGGYAAGQAVAVVSLPTSACTSPPCAAVARYLSLSGVPGVADPSAFPFPSGAVAVGSKVYVTLANLKQGGGYYGTPAGPGKLLSVDTANSDALSVVDLPGCPNPGNLVASGMTLWIACGGSCFSVPPVAGAVVAVDISGTTPVPGTALAAGVHSVGIALCGGMGYVSDQCSGDVVRFDPAGILPFSSGTAVCPMSNGFALAADVACAP